MSATCLLPGRMGNIFFNLSMLFAYCKRHSMTYYVPEDAPAYSHKKNPFNIPSTGAYPIDPVTYKEPNMSDGTPYYHEIAKIDEVLFEGYFQSFRYFDWCRDYILGTFNLPYKMEKGVVSVSVRRGDCLGSTAFPPAPPQYYHKAIEYMHERGYNLFRVYSDDQDWCRKEFTSENYNGATFEFSGGTELEDFISISGCEHNITARSTFSLTSAWVNQNPDKIVLVPQEYIWWKGQNRDLIPEYFTQIKWDEYNDSEFSPYELTYENTPFILMIPDYWVKIYRGQQKEPLYNDYCLMLNKLKSSDKNKYVLDIGMNHGLFSVPASKLGYKIVGFEPVAKNVRTLTLARDINGLKDFNIYKFALSNKNGETDIYVPVCPDNASLSKEAAISNMGNKDYTVEKVDTTRFDDWIVNHPAYKDIGFIKIDVQGAEFMIFEGMREYLTTHNDIWMVVEYEHHLNTMGYSFQQLDELLISYGFTFKGNISPTDKIFYKK